MDNHIIGVDIGGTKCAVSYGICNASDIRLIDKVKIKTGNPAETIKQLIDSIEQMIKKHNLSYGEISSIGVSCGGPLDSEKGIILSPPNLPGWDKIPIVRILTDHFRIPAKLQNDANACALAEWKMGAGKGTRNMVFITFGTGLGAGLILNGQLYVGHNDNAGELGHIRLNDFGPVGYGKAGSFEGFCSGSGISQLAAIFIREKIQKGELVSWCDTNHPEDISAKQVADAAFNGDQLAIEIFRTSAVYLGKGLSILIDLLNPEMIVIGSIYARSNTLMDPYLMDILQKESLPKAREVCQIKPTALGENIGDYAALSVAMYLIDNMNGKQLT